jgi:hypothetical protein
MRLLTKLLEEYVVNDDGQADRLIEKTKKFLIEDDSFGGKLATAFVATSVPVCFALIAYKGEVKFMIGKVQIAWNVIANMIPVGATVSIGPVKISGI